MFILIGLCVFFLSFTPAVEAAAGDWWSLDRDFRVSVTISANGQARVDKPGEIELNFTTLLTDAGVSGTFDRNSLLVVEVDNAGVIDDQVPFQFDPSANYNATSNASGTLVILLSGTTNVNTDRNYHVYFETSGKSFLSPVFTDQVVVSTVTDEEMSSFRVKTENATYFYQKEAGGFSSLLDVDDNDWLNYHANPANSPSSTFRGIPNMVNPESKLHPGAIGHSTTLEASGPIKETIHTLIDTDGDPSHQWDVKWDFFPTYARMTVNDIEHNYWFLYEGTPGGDLEPASDFVVRSNGATNLAANGWTSDLAGEEWVYFADPVVDRSLFLVSHEQDSFIDSYRPMSDSFDDMTVFGFGRNNLDKLLSKTPAFFTIGLMDTTNFADAPAIVGNAYKPLTIIQGGVEVQPIIRDTTPPVISNIQVTSISTNSATISWTTNEASISLVNYGTSSSYGKTSSNSALTTSHNVTLTGLSPNSIYHYQVASSDVSNNKAQSGDSTFTTLSVLTDTTPPVISNIQVTSITASSAIISWTTNEASDSLVSFGTSSSYGNTRSTSALVATHNLTLTGLRPNTIYHYRVASADVSNNKALSGNSTFTTLFVPTDTTAPVISNIQVTSITTSSATISWTTNEASNSQVNYGKSSSYGNTRSNAALITSHNFTLTGLSSNTIYHFQVTSADGGNNTARGGDSTFITKPTVSPIFKLSLPEIFQQKVPALIEWKVPQGFDPERKAFFHFSKDGLKWSLIKQIHMEKESFYWKPSRKRFTDNGYIRMCAKPEKGKDIDFVCETLSNIKVIAYQPTGS